MTNEERDLITKFIQRVGGVQPGGFAASGGAPGGAPPLPPVDPEADALIAELLARHPEARYRLTQTAFVQEQALVQAQNRIQRLEWELQQARQQAQGAQVGASPWGAPPQQAGNRGFFGGLFGGGARQQPPPPQYAPPPPQYPPGYNPGMFQQQRGGSGFLGGALATAAGVAGGMVAGNALMGLFSGGHGDAGSLASAPGELGTAAAAANPWGGDAAASDPYAAGGDAKDVADNSGWGNVEQGGWQQPVADQNSWDNQQTIDTADSGGWSDGGGDDWS
jgi:hypothetical protein